MDSGNFWTDAVESPASDRVAANVVFPTWPLLAHVSRYSPTRNAVEPAESDGQSIDVILDLLGSQRRRDVLACLTDTNDPIALADLAADVGARESERALSEIPDGELQTISTSLYHTHLPKLADAGVIEYDDSDLIRAAEPSDRIDRIRSLADDR